MRDLASSFLIASLAASMAAQAPQPKMGEPLHGLTAAQLQAFADGRVDFSTPLTVAEGLGPLTIQWGSPAFRSEWNPGEQFKKNPRSVPVTPRGFFASIRPVPDIYGPVYFTVTKYAPRTLPLASSG